MKKDTIICCIPARGGSKSCPRKNIREVCGKPLLAYPIIKALQTPEIQATYVSTDDPETADIAKKYGAEVPFLRPKEYCRDDSPDIEWALHFLAWFHRINGYFPEMIVHLRATTPIIAVDKLQDAIRAFKNDKEATSLVSVEEYTDSPYKAFLIDGKYVTGLIDIKNHECPKQSFPQVYHPNGYIDILKVSVLLKGEIHGDKILPFITEKVIEIDSEYEFDLLEMFMNSGRGVT